MPIVKLAKRFPRAGRISCGFQAAKPKQDKPDEIVTFPQRSKTLIVHSNEQPALEVWRGAYGGEIRQSPIDDDKFYLQTEATQIPVVLPSDDLSLVCSQWMEAHTSGGLQRKCDGNTCVLWRDEPTTRKGKNGKTETVPGELRSEERFCICEDEGLDDKSRCKPVIRLSVLPADIWADLPGLGVWVVTSAGWGSNTELANDLELIQNLIGRVGGGVRLMLSVEQISSRHGDVPMLKLGLEGSLRQAHALAAAAGRPLIEAGTTTDVLGAGDDAIGTFVNTQTGEIVEGETVADEPAVADTPPVATIAGILVYRAPGGPHTPADTDAELRSKAQLDQLTRMCLDCHLEVADVQAMFEAAYDFPIQVGTKLQVQTFTDWLKEAAKDRVARAAS